jgi:predicted lipid-binding transport protein (Tim44 family)
MTFLNLNFQNEDIFIMVLLIFILILASVLCFATMLVSKKGSAKSENQPAANAAQKGYPLPAAINKAGAKTKEQAPVKEKKSRKLFGGKKEAKTEAQKTPSLPKITIKQELPSKQDAVAPATVETQPPQDQKVEEASQPKPDFSTIQEPVLQQNPPELEKLTENKEESAENEEEKGKSIFDLFNDDSMEESEINKFASQFDDVNMDSIVDTGVDLLTQIKNNMN